MFSKKEFAVVNFFEIYLQDKFRAQLSWAWKKIYNIRVRLVISGKDGGPKLLNENHLGTLWL